MNGYIASVASSNPSCLVTNVLFSDGFEPGTKVFWQ